MASNFPVADSTALASLFERAHERVAALHKLNYEIAALVERHLQTQEEVRAVRRRINQEIERSLKSNRSVKKLEGG